MTQNSEECASCFFQTDFPGMIIESNGSCNYCNNSRFKNTKDGQVTRTIEELKDIATDIRNNNKGKYDCVIGASGGLDSSYVLYMVKKVLSLNPLVINYDHGLNHDIAGRNLRSICNALGVDFITVQSKKGYDKKYVREIIKAVRHIDLYWGVCSFCQYILPAVVYKKALENKIKYEMVSSNLYEESLYLTTRIRMKYMLKALLKKQIWKIPMSLFHIAKAIYYLIRLKLEFYVPPIRNLYSGGPDTSGLVRIDISEFVEWDIDKMVELLRKELFWEPPGHPQIPMRFDCMIDDSLMSQTYLNAVGITDHCIICNNLIYDKIRDKSQLSDAARYYNNPEIVKKNVEYLIEKLNIR